MKQKAEKWLEQFGINVLSIDTVDVLSIDTVEILGIDAVTNNESLEVFLKLVGSVHGQSQTVGDFRLVCYCNWRSSVDYRVSYKVYDAANNIQLGWLTLRKPAASTKVYVSINSDA